MPATTDVSAVSFVMERANLPSSSITSFSLFDGDLLNRTFGRIGLNTRRGVHIAGRWKVIVWTRSLYRMSRLRLVLVASHPDQMGGVGFISEVQARFAIVIVAYGNSNVAAVIAYKVAIEHAPLTLPPVWGPALGFMICAPLLFTVPLLMFTKQLFRTKRRALSLYREQVLQRALAFEARCLSTDASGVESEAAWLSSMNHLAMIFGRIEHMRAVPFDFKSAAQLVASTVGSVATVLPLLKIEGPLKDWLELLSAVLKHGG